MVVSKLDFVFSKDTLPIHSIICFIPAACPSPFQGTALWTLKHGCPISPDVSSPAQFFQFLPLFFIYPWNWFELLRHPGQCPGHTCFNIKDSAPNWTKWSRQEVWSFSLSGYHLFINVVYAHLIFLGRHTTPLARINLTFYQTNTSQTLNCTWITWRTDYNSNSNSVSLRWLLRSFLTTSLMMLLAAGPQNTLSVAEN